MQNVVTPRLSDPFVQQYSPIPIGLGSPVAVYMGLGFLAYLGVVLPNWVWWLGAAILCSGLVLGVATKRVVYIRAYQAIVMGVVALVHGTLLLTVASDAFAVRPGLALAAVVGVTVLATGIGAYQHRRQSQPDIASWPVGHRLESFNAKTGAVTRRTSSQQVEQQERVSRGYARLDRLAPLIAGLAMLIAGRLEGSASTLAIAFVAFVVAFGGAAGAGAIAFYFVAAMRWERDTRINIWVKHR
jgi:hypothetical protein